MDKVMRDLFGDEPTVAPAMTPDLPTTAATGATTQAEAPEAEREARRAARQERKTDHEARRRRKEFVDRYTTGEPSEGFTTEEALTHLREMSGEMSPREFRRAMERTLDHLSPSQREDFVKIMQEYKASQPAAPASGAAGASGASGGAAADPFGGVLSGLMGNGVGGGVGLDDLIADLQQGGLRGSATPTDRPATEADFQALLNSPLARAVLGGVAAFAIQETPDEDKPQADQATR